MFQLQRAIIRPKTEQSPGTFSDYALYGTPYACCQVFSSADLIHVVLLTVTNCYVTATHSGMASIKIILAYFSILKLVYYILVYDARRFLMLDGDSLILLDVMKVLFTAYFILSQ